MVTLGDVAGKGVAAAVLMASIQAAIRSQAMHLDGPLSRMMEGFNKAVCSFSTVDKYSTLFLSVLERDLRKLTYVNAGQVRPMLLRGCDHSIQPLALGGMPVGLVPESTYKQGEVALEPGDVILACSDGVSESMNSAEEFWDDAEVERILRRYAACPAAEIIDRLVAAADEFAAGADQHDDITVAVLKIV
jgi:sigma-B regulation protein RsbU (phosphoserine phosphatase)